MKESQAAGKRRGALLAIAGGAAVVGLSALAFVYFYLMAGNSPSKLTIGTVVTSSPSASGSAGTVATTTTGASAGTWNVGSGSVAGYRVREQLGGASAPSDAVGRTSAVSGSMTLQASGSGYQVSAASFTVQLNTLTSDRAMRDQRIHTMGLESDRYPTATFTLTSPIALPAVAGSGQAFTVQATGDLTIHGVTKSITIPLQAQLNGSQIAVAGSITFPFSQFGMTPPSIGNFVTVQNDATMEFALSFQHA
jgi:polyisoprenoid-binding protein YceI